MRRCLFGVVLAVSVFAVDVCGQEKTPKPETNSVEVRFADGSTVKMTLLDSQIDIVTRYGRLTVPAADIRRIEFGLHVPAETAKRIEALIAQLGSRDAKQRDEATAELVALRELAYPRLKKAVSSASPDMALRMVDVFRALNQTLPPEAQRLPAHDTVIAGDFTMIGQVESPVLRARSPYFGEAKLNPAELRSIRFLADGRESRLSVDAARFGGVQEAWFDTGIDLRAGAALQITATGAVQVTLNDGTITSVGPDGASRRGIDRGNFGAAGGPGGGGFPGGGLPGGRAVRGGGGGFASFSGALMGRVGEGGRNFLVGSSYDGSAPTDGRLYLRIGSDPNGAGSSGKYDVRVNAGR